jgi:sigma-B regulation protein RsbU (phosphoserine phosphatase)
MILTIAGPTLVIYVAILGVAMAVVYRESKQGVERGMTQLASSYASRFDGQLREAAQIAETSAGFVETVGALPDEKIYEQLQGAVARSPLVYGACMAFEPGAVKPPGELFAPYVCRNVNGEGFRRLNIDRSVYDWYRDPQYTWYTRPKSLGRGAWSEPYFDEGAGNILMATYSAPFRLNGKFGGVCTVDIDLPRLHKTAGAAFDQDLDFVILAADGRFVYDRDPSRILSRTIFEVAREQNRPALDALGRRMLAGKAGVASVDGWDSPERQWVFFAPIRSTNWVFACRFPESRVLAEVRGRALWGAAALGVTLALIVACIVLASRRVASPVTRLKQKVVEVAAGNLDVRTDATGGSEELRELGDSFNRMTGQLRAQVERLAAEQAARARIENDLEIARSIQQSLLPAADPTNARLDIAGRSRYCDETGGDYYDFIDVSNPTSGTTVIAVGDVSGHGIASALLMASARAGLRVQAADAGQLSMLLNRVNRLLASDNRHQRFMTMALLVIDAERGDVRWASAGHDPAIIFHPDDGTFDELDGGGLPLGVEPDAEYEEYALPHALRPGDVLILGTDGIWEMRDPAAAMFGKERLRDVIREFRDRPAREIAAAVEQRLDEFRAGGCQKDDVTFVIVRMKAQESDRLPEGEDTAPVLCAEGERR